MWVRYCVVKFSAHKAIGLRMFDQQELQQLIGGEEVSPIQSPC